MKRYTARRASSAFVGGLALASAAMLLTACGTSTGAPSENKAATELGDNESSVSILAWPGYVEDGSNDTSVDWVSAFEKQTGCEVTSKT